ncbi:hypothetical protein [Rhodosalinus halophilus]|nr:hypothetical protein [Rhodosalinus halophilus]
MSVLPAHIADLHDSPFTGPCATNVLVNGLRPAPERVAAAGEEIAP